MTPASCLYVAALGLVVGGLMMAGLLLQARGRAVPGVVTTWERFDLPDGITCIVWKDRAVSCVLRPIGGAEGEPAP